MDVKTRLLILLFSLIWLLVVLKLVKRRRIWERYAIFWVFTGAALMALPFFVGTLDALISRLKVVDSPPNFFFLVGFIGVLFILLQSTVEITSLMRQNREAIQDLAILDEKVRELEEKLNEERARREERLAGIDVKAGR